MAVDDQALDQAAPSRADTDVSPSAVRAPVVAPAPMRLRGGSVARDDAPATGGDGAAWRDAALDLTTPCPATVPPRLGP